MTSNFPSKSLAQAQTEFEALVASSPGAVNAGVAELSALVVDQAALTIEDLKCLEMWLLLKTPEVSGQPHPDDLATGIRGPPVRSR